MIPLFGRFAVVRFDKAAADEQNVPKLYIPTLRFWTNVNSLIFAALIELLVGNSMGFIWIVLYALLMRVGPIVQQDATACNPMLGPMMNGTLVVRLGPCDIYAMSVVVEGGGSYVSDL